jgi:hypothetical protein
LKALQQWQRYSKRAAEHSKPNLFVEIVMCVN